MQILQGPFTIGHWFVVHVWPIALRNSYPHTDTPSVCLCETACWEWEIGMIHDTNKNQKQTNKQQTDAD